MAALCGVVVDGGCACEGMTEVLIFVWFWFYVVGVVCVLTSRVGWERIPAADPDPLCRALSGHGVLIVVWFVDALIWVGVGRRGAACRGRGDGAVFGVLCLICLFDSKIGLL